MATLCRCLRPASRPGCANMLVLGRHYSSQPEKPEGQSRHSGPANSGRIGGMPLPDIEYGSSGSSRWRSLTGSEKVRTAARQTGSFGVVLAGGSLALLVLYTLGTELFSKDSPTRYYEKAIDIVTDSELVNSILYQPFSFYTTPPGLRRRQNMNVQSSLARDSRTGQDLMFLKFWVEASASPDDPASHKSWLSSIHDLLRPIVWDSASYVSSKETPQLTVAQALAKPQDADAAPPAPQKSRIASLWDSTKAIAKSSVAGFFPSNPNASQPRASSDIFQPRRGHYTTAEVTAELTRDPTTSEFVFNRILVDFPTSHSPRPYRVSLRLPDQRHVREWWRWW